MDLSQTASFELEPQRNRNGAAVVLLHGFTGSPWDMRSLGESLCAHGYFVHAPRLAGHGASPEAMAWVTVDDWEASAEAALAAVDGYRTVFFGGLSMGALLGVLLAARHPGRFSGMALMAPAWRLDGVGPRTLRALRRFRLASVRSLWLTKDSTDIEDAALRAQAPLMRKYPVARLFDFFTLQDRARAAAATVETPTLIFGAEHDHVIDPRGVVELAQTLKHAQLVTLRRGFHIIPRDHERALVASRIAQFFAERTARAR